MSSLAQKNYDDYPEAAKRNLSEACSLNRSGHYDGAAYLSGYTVECVLKTLLLLGSNKNAPYTHNINSLGITLQVLASIQPKIKRYADALNTLSFPYGEPPNGWKETLRYRKTGTITQQIADEWIKSAHEYNNILIELVLDGEVTMDP